jgi:chitinase
VKVYIGAPASSSAAGSGYVSATSLLGIALDTRNNFPSFGGVMFWGKVRRKKSFQTLLQKSVSYNLV